MRFLIALLSPVLALSVSLKAHAGEGHDHDEKETSQTKEDKHDHGSKDEHAAEEKEGHGEEENSQVGPGKGIVSASEEEGIQISPEAEKNFEIKRIAVPASLQLELPKSAIVTAGTEINVFRYRNGHYKRIDFSTVNKAEGRITIKSVDLKAGDEIVIQGTGLLRIAEIAAFGGAPEGHSH